MNKLQKYSNLKVGDIVYIKPNSQAGYILNYNNNENMTIRKDWSILGLVKEIHKPDPNYEIYNVIITPISSNFGLRLDYPIHISNDANRTVYTRPKDITVLSD